MLPTIDLDGLQRLRIAVKELSKTGNLSSNKFRASTPGDSASSPIQPLHAGTGAAGSMLGAYAAPSATPNVSPAENRSVGSEQNNVFGTSCNSRASQVSRALNFQTPTAHGSGNATSVAHDYKLEVMGSGSQVMEDEDDDLPDIN